jgi:hypothetical protein
MATYSYKAQSGECGVKDLYLEFAVGATGAVGAYARRQGFTQTPSSAVRNSAGNYTLNLDQRWQALVDFNGKVVGAVAVGDGSEMTVVSRNLNVAQPNVVVQFRRTDTGAAADPPNPSSVLIHLQLKDSTV